MLVVSRQSDGLCSSGNEQGPHFSLEGKERKELRFQCRNGLVILVIEAAAREVAIKNLLVDFFY